ncbi:glycosyltransferase family 4 protein [Rhodothermus bifroesti]|nr:glycosyltransferase family 4 protein [Rhodothermus bifroesti]
MLTDFPSTLLRSAEGEELWRKHFLPTPVLNLLESLSRISELEVSVLSFSRSGTAAGTLWGRIHVEMLQVPRGSGLSTLYLLRRPSVLRAVERLRPDIVHGQGIEAGYAWLATLQPCPHLLTFHGVYGVTAYLKPRGIWQHLGHVLQRVTLRRARHIVAISHYLEDWFRQSTRASVYFIPNAVNNRFYQVKSTGKAEFDLLYVGRITESKGLLEAIKVVARLEKKGGRGLKMAVVGRASDMGGEDYLKRCRQQAEALERSKVFFLGAVPNDKLPEILSVSKLLVLPSQGENFSMVAAEASAAGVPVVAYRVGGLPTVVEHGETGLLVPPGDIQSLSSAVEELIGDERLRLRFARATRERAMSWHQDTVARRTAELYGKIIAKETSWR